MVHVSDINNEPPKFSRDSYEKHVSERLAEGELVLKVSASDPDLDAKLVYSILEPVVVKDKTGVEVKSKSVKFFKINQTTGEIFSVHKLDHQLAAIITFGVRVEDQNAVERVEMQHAISEYFFCYYCAMQTHGNHATPRCLCTKQQQTPIMVF